MRFSLILLLFAGCTTAAALPDPIADTCNAAAYGDLIGQPATALERVLLLGKVRVIRPNDAVTMDYRTERINFMITEDERIMDIRCG